MAIPYPMPTTMAPQGAYLGSPDILGRLKAGLAGNSNALLGYGLSILSGNPQAAAAAFAAGSARDDAYATSQKAEAQRQQTLNQTAQWAQRQFPDLAGAPPELIAQMAPTLYTAQKKGDTSLPSSVQEYLFAKQNGYDGTFEDWRKGGNQTPKGGLGEPMKYYDPATQSYHPVQQFTDGSTIDLTTGKPPDPSLKYDPLGYLGQKASVTTNATVDAKTEGAARAALPGAEQAAAITNRVTDALLNNTGGMAEQFGKTLGVIPNQYIPDWAAAKGSPMALFRSQLAQGQGSAFMQARQMLKGGGQITDFEGAKAEAAFSQMQLAAQNNDQQQFMQAVVDFREAVNAGLEKLRAAANGGYAKGSPNVTGNGDGSAPSVDDLLQKYQ